MSLPNNPIKFADPNGDDPIGDQYKIRKGDMYTSIAKDSGGKFTVAQLKSWNNGVDPTKLQIGRNINVSDPG
ncbi:MAG TPA: LysM domain-containing protein [Chitinophagaceae bacterium]